MRKVFLIIGLTILFVLITTSCKNEIVLKDRLDNEVFKIRNMDILFVLDNSRTMAMKDTVSGESKIEKIAASVDNFITSYTSDAYNVNFKIGMTFSNMPAKIRPIGEYKIYEFYPGELVADVIDSETYSFKSLEDLFLKIVPLVEGNTNIEEKPFLSVYNVMTLSSAMNGSYVNTGFYSPKNDLSVVLLTDEDDGSDGFCSTSEKCLDKISSFKKKHGARVVFNAIADELGTCHNPTSYSAIEFGAAKIKDIVNSSGGLFTKLCEPKQGGTVKLANNFNSFFTQIGKNMKTRFPLKMIPDVNKMEVFLNDSLLTIGSEYTFEETTFQTKDGATKKIGEIVFFDHSTPVFGDEIRVEYKRK